MKARIDNATRRAIYRRDGWECAVCGDPRRLQIHHIVERSQGGGDEQMNLVTLCMACHAAVHGTKIVGYPMDQEDVEQAVVEYMADYYAGMGVRWPDGAIIE